MSAAYFMERARRVVSYYWPTNICTIDLGAMMTEEIMRGILSSGFGKLLTMAFLIAVMAYFFFCPILKAIMRRPLRTYLGMEFEDFRISLLSLSISFTDIELVADSPITILLLGIIFPSALVQKYKPSVEYPASKITIARMKVGLRMGLVVRNFDKHDGAITFLSTFTKQLLDLIFLRPVISIKLNRATFHIEKLYLAPRPPPEMMMYSTTSLPSAIAPDDIGSEIPVFNQDYMLDFLRLDELRNADYVTFYMERWLQNAMNKAAMTASNNKTDDEKSNALIESVMGCVLRSLSINLTDSSIVLSGAGTKVVKELRKQHGPRETNLMLAKLTKQQRSLTIIGTEAITISYSPDVHCNLLLSLVGVHIKVGDPVSKMASGKPNNVGAVKYAWQTVTHPFDMFLELKGVLPLIVWALNYDHDWPARKLALNLTTSDIAICLSPEHLQTLLLHLDDYIDAMNPYNEWYMWLCSNLHERFKKQQDLMDKKERFQYCRSYALLKGTKMNEDTPDSSAGSGDRLTSVQLTQIEKQLTRFEIVSLRCHAMKNGWKIPNANDEFAEFMRGSKSRICGKGEDGRATPLDVITPFQRFHRTSQHALAVLVMNKYSFLSPEISINFSAKALAYEFPRGPLITNPNESSTKRTVPSSLCLFDLTLAFKYTSPLLFSAIPKASSDMQRPVIDLSINTRGLEWNVIGTRKADEPHPPAFANNSLVGIISKQREAPSSLKVFRAIIRMSVSPTKNQDPSIAIDLWSSDLVVLLNPSPLISVLETLIEFSAIPFNPPKEKTSDDSPASDVVISTKIHASVANTSILFMSDFTEILRGVLVLDIDDFSFKVQSTGMSGELVLSTVPITLSAGQIVQHLSSSDDPGIEWTTIPCKPIITIQGIRLRAAGKEIISQLESSSDTTPSCMEVHIDCGADSFILNASPSALVALNGVSLSLDPLLAWAAGDIHEEERIRLENEAKLEEERTAFRNRREALRAVFNSVDVDESGILQDDEIVNMIHVLLAENIEFGNDASQIVDAAQRLTPMELMRELDFLFSTLDPMHPNEISYQDVDSILYLTAHDVDDNNLCPKIGTTGVEYLDDFSNSNVFLSARTMRSIIYYDDLREYSAMHEVYRLTGYTKLGNGLTFPAPSLWHQGRGIDLFWDLYTTETGCSQNSLNGQNPALIQRKLVRCLCNYQFAKFCWKSMVQPQLHAAYSDGEGTDGHTLTYWLLDDDPLSRINEGVLDRLLRHIHHISKEPRGPGTHIRISLAAGVERATLTLGSSCSFTNSLFSAEFSQVNIIGCAFASLQTGWFVPENKFDEADHSQGQPNLSMNDDGNTFHFRSAFSVYYLNSKHDHMECFIESYPCFGNLAYKTFVQESLVSDGSDPKTATFTVNVNCPRSLNINALPSFFGAVSTLSRAASQLDFQTYREMFSKRENEFLRNLWDKKDPTCSGFLCPDEAIELLRLAGDMHWKREVATLAAAKKDELIRSIFSIGENDEVVAYHDVQKVLELKSSRYYYSGCKEIHLENCTGRDLKVGTAATETYQSVEASCTAAVVLSNRTAECQLSLLIDRYKPIHGIAISPYQSSMLPLIRIKKKTGAKQHCISGFSTHLTLCPKSDCLDSINLLVRPCVTIQTDIPIRVRIVRLGKSLGYLKKKGAKSQIDLSKKGFLVALNRLVEGAQIVFEKNDVTKGNEVPLPLSVIDSSRHYHVLLIFDGTNWRDPVLLTKDFLFNPMSLREVSRCHALSGIVIRKERLYICLPHMQRFSPIASESKKCIMHRTAWDTTIQVVPFFLLSNSMPFPILARSWQLPSKKDEAWRDNSFLADEMDNVDDNLSSDDDLTAATPSIKCKGLTPFQVHKSDGSKGQNGHVSIHVVERGETLQMSGINLREPFFIQLAQRLHVVGESDETSSMWSKPLQIEFGKLRTGINPKGSFALPKIPLDIGDSCSVLIDVSVEGGIRMPICTIYSPCWIMNKTGAKLEYKVKLSSLSKRYYLDSGSGGLPIMLHCGKSDREMSVIQLECPRKDIATQWWDASCNGNLVMKQHALTSDIRNHTWSETISLDSAGTCEEIQCGRFTFSVTVESLAGPFYRSNLITLAPRFILKNLLHIGITILPICGTKSDALQKARELRRGLSGHDERNKLDLCANETTIIYNFIKITAANGPKLLTNRWIAFCVNSIRKGDFCKWHLIPIEKIGSTYFGEHDGLNNPMCGIVRAKVHQCDGAKVASITHELVPPFRIENRSNDHVIQFVQDDDDAVMFELFPMHSCGFTWDNPHGRKVLRAVVLHNGLSEDGRGISSNESGSSYRKYHTDMSDDCLDDGDSLSTTKQLSTGEGAHSKHINAGDFCSQSVVSYNLSRTSKRSRLPTKLGRVYSANSRGYNLSKVGIKRELPCPPELAFPPLHVHLRISAGMKILSFNDSPWFIEQVESGLLKKGGDYKSAICNVRVDGFTFYIMDDFPREVMGIIMKDLHIFKRTGSIEAGMKIRHFQVDAMLDTARYPIIIQPKQRGFDRHASHAPDRSLCGVADIEETDCFWLKSDDAEPIFEVAFSYVPQSNMTWVPNIEVFICPMKIQLDVDYILRVVGMLLNSASKYQAVASSNYTTTTHANNELKYVTYEQLESRQTYIEKLYIAPVLFEMEINLKPDEDHSGSQAGESALTLNSIARSTNSAAVAGILSWVINVGANFAHVSPTFTYNAIVDNDRYCDIFELATDIVISYIVRSIKQSYKVVFSMNLLGDPSLLAYQYKTGITDLVLKTRDELAAGGKDGFGKGIVSFSHNVVGGTFFAAGKISGGLSETLESIVDSQLVSSHLKPKLAIDERKRPRHVVQGFNQGMIFLGRTIVHGVAGLIGNPYRGMQSSTSGPIIGFSQGFVSGTVGLIVAPLIGTLGLMAKTCDGMGATTKFIGELGAIEARCRPARIVSWGAPVNDNELSYLKGIGIRVHTVRYQKVRKQTVQKNNANRDEDGNGRMSSREFLKLRAAEDRRKNPPRKVVNILYKKEREYNTAPRRPKLLTDQNGNRAVVSQDKYSVCFEETIVLESSNLQLTDEVVIQFRNNKTIKSAPGSSSKLSGVCILTVGDMHSMILNYYRERLNDIESSLAEEITSRSSQTPIGDLKCGTQKKTLTIPAPQEYSLFRPVKAKMFCGDIYEAIVEEMQAIREAEEEAFKKGHSDSSQSESDASFLIGGSTSKKAKVQDRSEIVRANERLFGSVSLSFFPVM